jgi:hypothetical protein
MEAAPDTDAGVEVREQFREYRLDLVVDRL